MKTEALNKASSHHPPRSRTQANDVLAQAPDVAQGLDGTPGPCHTPDPSSRGRSQPENVDMSGKKAGSLSWADRVKTSQKVVSGSLPQHANGVERHQSAAQSTSVSTDSSSEITPLKRENALMKETIQKLMLEIADIKKNNSSG
ncbi:hypothetical protein MTO96_049819 [Rhipicephalus appendiculatus]